MDRDTRAELVDNRFHDLVKGLTMIRNAAHANSMRITFMVDNDHVIVGPRAELEPLLNSWQLEATGFKPSPDHDVWVFDTSVRAS